MVCLLCLLCLAGNVPAQQENRLILDQKVWKKKASGLDYTEKLPDQKQMEEEAEPENEGFDSISPSIGASAPWLKSVLFIALIFVLLVVIGIVIYRARQPANIRQVRVEAKSVEEAEENLPEVELDQLYLKSLEDGTLKIALRIKFLMVLQALIDCDMVVWKKRKTNHAYELEIQNGSIRQKFVDVTTIFERVWYGNNPIERSEFDRVVYSMENLKNDIHGQ